MLVLATGLSAFSQDPVILTVTQPDPLQVNAGNDVQINKGESTIIGGSPSASLGYGSYIYSWSPATGLDDPTLANPLATPLTNTTYLLTVTDAMNCSSSDEVSISVDATGVEILPAGLKIRCYPNPVEEDLFIEIQGKPAEVTIRLISPIGKELLLRESRMTGNTLTERIPMQDFPCGIYVLQCITTDAIHFQRIVKTR